MRPPAVSAWRRSQRAGDLAAEQSVESALLGRSGAIADVQTFVAAALDHGVAGILIHAGASAALPDAARAALRADAHRHAAVWAARHRILSEVFTGAADAGVDLLVFKGAHLAYAVYPEISLRQCADADLFVRPGHRPAFLDLLQSLGFVECATNTGDVALGQATYERPGGVGSVLDVHSRLVTPFAFAERFGFAELWTRSEAVRGWPPNVRVPAPLDALEIAILHQAVHHRGRIVLLWTYDMYLLLQMLGAADVARFCTRVDEGVLPSECLYPLLDAQRRFPTEAGAAIAAHIGRKGTGAEARPLTDGERLRRHAADVQRLPRRRALRVLAAHAFPPSDYMRQTYAPGSRMPLPVLYARRIVRGFSKLFTGLSAN